MRRSSRAETRFAWGEVACGLGRPCIDWHGALNVDRQRLVQVISFIPRRITRASSTRTSPCPLPAGKPNPSFRRLLACSPIYQTCQSSLGLDCLPRKASTIPTSCSPKEHCSERLSEWILIILLLPPPRIPTPSSLPSPPSLQEAQMTQQCPQTSTAEDHQYIDCLQSNGIIR